MHLVGILFPHINKDARSKSHKTFRYVFRPKGRIGHPGLQPFCSFSQFLRRMATSCIETVHNMVFQNPYPLCITYPFHSLLYRPNLCGWESRYSKNDIVNPTTNTKCQIWHCVLWMLPAHFIYVLCVII